MNLRSLVAHSHEAFFTHTSNVRVALLHPQSRYRSLLVAKLVNDSEIQTLYYALGPDDVSVLDFLAGLIRNLPDQHPGFGHNLNLAASMSGEDGQAALLEALAADLDEWTTAPFLLILDEYDYADGADDIQQFTEGLVALMPVQGTLVINSRTMPRLPWVSLIARNDAVILGDEKPVTGDFYGILGDRDNPQLEVEAFGPGHVSFNGKSIASWEGHLPRLLFFLALDRPAATRSEICKALWPELATDQAVNVFHVTKRRLHKALGQEILVHDHGYYRINADFSLRYDVMDFVSMLVEGRIAEGEDKIAWLQKAVAQYKGPFLQGQADQWVKERRMDYRSGYVEAITAMAEMRYGQGQTERALHLYRHALDADSLNQETHRRAMRLFAELGRRSEVAAHYQTLKQDLAKRGQAIDAETETLFQEIMA